MNSEKMTNLELQPLPIHIRGHHLVNFAKMTTEYSLSHPPVDEMGEIIPLEKLYLYPEQGAIYLRSQVDDWVKFQAEGYDNLLTILLGYKDTLDDYFGEDGVRIQQFTEGKAAFFQQIFLSNPETMIELDTMPDAICYSCQISPENEIGRHCRVVSEADGEYVNFMKQALTAMSLQYEQSKEDSISFRAEYIRRPDVMTEILKAKAKMYPGLLQLLEQLEE